MVLSILNLVGLSAQGLFIGGNVVVSSVTIPSISEGYIAPETKAKIFLSLYDRASKIMIAASSISFLAFGSQAFKGGLKETLTSSYFATAALSIAPIPLTLFFIFPVIDKIHAFVQPESAGKVAVNEDIDNLISTWNKLSIVRASVFSLGLVNIVWHFLGSNIKWT
ncbi:Piso0_001281 [Millerozyma farinosa CBS 7064]|uniref:Piso0_001281 protein n=1 Tax=Pichia sorbitophila (strain ATCC MYA-4447 / BCRC 22081 / CBS 7064 / NBRC 10061 / NRRL Y-12695) TaxID=559304 RepID=G8YMR2_PICSO|nr:Piso0_001281 [Millerozyma farinosa CBS 7064]